MRVTRITVWFGPEHDHYCDFQDPTFGDLLLKLMSDVEPKPSKATRARREFLWLLRHPEVVFPQRR